MEVVRHEGCVHNPDVLVVELYDDKKYMIAFFFLVHPPVLKVTNSERSEVGMTRLPNRKEGLTNTLYRVV